MCTRSYFIPAIVMVAVSFLGFLIDPMVRTHCYYHVVCDYYVIHPPQSTPARVALGIIST